VNRAQDIILGNQNNKLFVEELLELTVSIKVDMKSHSANYIASVGMGI
jgi:hypothetical protein